jgi:hypothetical protein
MQIAGSRRAKIKKAFTFYTWVSRVPFDPHVSGGLTQQAGSVSWGAGVTEAGHSWVHAAPHLDLSAGLVNLHPPMHDSLVGLSQANRHTYCPVGSLKPALQRELHSATISSRDFFTPLI